jgi:hypothetical protein
MNSVLAAGVSGIQSGISNAHSAAQKIASATTAPIGNEAVDGADQGNTANAAQSGGLNAITEGAVELVRSEQQVQASAAVVQTADETLGTLINTLA